ncbi:MAG: DUF4148 domain-containing protein [Trinickia sp.]|jgi:hypothetical protein|uniref:DUF4148 domain-containing protein n=1 Tax=Trinickia sp. TaxID=2571163 RepID=UPI003F80BEBF
MKSLIQTIAIAAAFAAPVAAFAQSNAPVTRAQVQTDLVQFQQAGGRTSIGADPFYPQDAQVAQARVGEQNGNNQAVGGVQAGSSASGSPAKADALKSLYSGV